MRWPMAWRVTYLMAPPQMPPAPPAGVVRSPRKPAPPRPATLQPSWASPRTSPAAATSSPTPAPRRACAPPPFASAAPATAPAATGTTETSNSAAFLGFTQNVAGSSYIFNDSGTASSLCTSPVRQCGSGNLYGGNEPARSFFTAAGPIANSYGGKKLPPVRQKQKKGSGELADGGAAAAQR